MILAHARFGELLADPEHALDDRIVGDLQQLGHRLLGQVLDSVVFHLLLQPSEQLIPAVRIVKLGELNSLSGQALLDNLVSLDRGMHQCAIDQHALVHHALVQMPELPLFVRHRKPGQLVGNLALGLDVAPAVLGKELPLRRVVLR